MNRCTPRLARPRHILGISSICALSMLSACSSPDPHAYAGRVVSPGELVGGPRSIGEVGDWRMSNGKVRFVIQDLNMIPAGAKPVYGGTVDAQGARVSPDAGIVDPDAGTIGVLGDRNYATFGGTLIDADLARPEAELDPRATGDGADGLGELFPAFFLSALEPDSIQVLDDGSSGHTARIRVTGKPSEFLTETHTIDGLILGTDGLTFAIDYALGADDDFLTITASMTNALTSAHTFPVDIFPVPIGFIGLFGQDQPLFLPGEAGFDVRFGLERSYSRKYALPALSGLTTDVIAVDSSRISYGISYCPECITPIPSSIPDSASFVFNHAAAYSSYGPVDQDTMLVPFVSGSLLGIFMGESPASLPPGQTYGVTMKLRVGPPTPSYQVDAVLGEQGVAVGQYTGRVREETTLNLLPNASVIVYSNASAADIDAGIAPQCASGPDGLGCMVTDAKTDSGGRFHALLAPGKYRAIVRDVPHPDAAPIDFTIAFNQETYQELYSPRVGTLVAEITDENGRLSPAKVTLSNSYDVSHSNQNPQTFLYDYRIGDPYRPTDLVPDTSDPETRRYIEDTFYAENGRVQADVRPGNYRATISRGPAWPIVEQEITISAGQATKIGATMVRALPANGWVQADFHVHAAHSVDSSTPYPRRALSLAGEGLDFAAMTEHNFIGDIRPTLVQEGLYDFLQATTGIEESSLEAGHWNAYPLQYDQTLSTHGALSWFRRDPADLFANLHDIGRWSPAATMVEVNHPRDSVQGYFTAYGMTGFAFTGDPDHDWPGKGCYQTDAGLAPTCANTLGLVPNGPGFGEDVFTLDNLQAMEVLNSKRYDLLTSYRVPQPLPDLPTCGTPDAGTNCIPPTCATQPNAKPCIGAEGTLVLDQNGQVAYPGAFEDWEHILDSGRRIVGVGNSDTHEQYDEPGTPRNLIYLGHDWASASQLDEQEITAALIAGKSVQTNGPEIELTLLDPNHKDANGKPIEVPIGGLVETDGTNPACTAPDAGSNTGDCQIQAHIIVRAAPWVQVSRVQLLVGKGNVQPPPDDTYGDPRASDVPCNQPANPCVDATSTAALRVDQVVTLTLNPGVDTWVAARATGDKTLWPVVTQFEVPPLLLNDAVAQLTGAFGVSTSLGSFAPSLISLVTPYALANPVFIDGNRDGVWGQPVHVTNRSPRAANTASTTTRGASIARGADEEGDLAKLRAALLGAARRAKQP